VDGYRRYLTNYLVNLHDHEDWIDAVASCTVRKATRGLAGFSRVGMCRCLPEDVEKHCVPT